MKKLNLLALLVVLLAITSCSEGIKKTITSESIEMSEEYAFAGSNTLTGVWNVDLNGIDIDSFDDARVTSIKIEMVEPGISDILSECIMQLATPGTNMQRIGVLNPIPDNVGSFEMKVADEQEDILELLKQKEITFVADINLEEDPESILSFKTTIEFEIEK